VTVVFRSEAGKKYLADRITFSTRSEKKEYSRKEADILKKAAELWPDEQDHQVLFQNYVDYKVRSREAKKI
jgi:hypothetical protein